MAVIWYHVAVMKTRVTLNDDLLQEAMRYTTATTKRALVEEALETFVKVKAATRQRARYMERLEALDARLQNLSLSQSPAELLRDDRDRR